MSEKFKCVVQQLNGINELGEQGGRIALFLPLDRELLHDSDDAKYVEVVIDTDSDELLARFNLSREERQETFYEVTIRQLSKGST